MDVIMRAYQDIVNGTLPSYLLRHQIQNALFDLTPYQIRLVADHYDSKSVILQFSGGLANTIVEDKLAQTPWGGGAIIPENDFINYPVSIEKDRSNLRRGDSHFIS